MPGGWPAAKLAEVLTNTRPAVADANYTAHASDRTIAFTSLTAARSVTLPAASAFPTGTPLVVIDESGSCSATNSITLARAGSDTINGAASTALNAAYAAVGLESNGATAWTIVAQIPNVAAALVGIGTAPDPANPLSVHGTNALFSSAGDIRIKVNKAASSNIASFLYQDGFSGRAEIGLAGDDNFHFKVSPDGSTWHDSLDITAASGLVTANFGLALAGATSGTTELAAAATASGTLTLPAATDTLVGRTTTDTLTNKSIDASANTITDLTTSMFAVNVVDTDPTLATDSDTRLSSQKAVKSYVDNSLTGLSWKEAVACATTANISLSGEQTIDGVATSASRVLVKNQTTASQNGIYVSGSGSWTRSSDAATGAELVNATVLVGGGTADADTQWTCNDISITLGTTSVNFVQLGGAGSYTAGTGLTLSGNQFAIDSTVATLTGAQTLTNKTFDTGGTGNVFKIAGTQYTAVTGTSGTLASSVSPTFTGTTSFGATTTSTFDNTGNLSLVSNGFTVGSSQLVVSGGNFGIGTTTPLQLLHMRLAQSGTSEPKALNGGATGDTHTFAFFDGSSGVVGAKVGVQFGGLDTYSTGGIFSQFTSTSGNTLGDLTFDLRKSSGDTSLTEAMRITSAGNVGIGTTSPGCTLDVNGQMRSTPCTVGTLPAGVDGARAFVTDSASAASGNFGAAVSGGGSNHVPVYYDGGTSTWRIG